MQGDKIPDEIMRVAHGLYADAQQRHNVTDIARALMARDKRAAEIANRYVNPPFLGCASTAHSIATAILTYGGSDERG